jgi:hypothetical protein
MISYVPTGVYKPRRRHEQHDSIMNDFPALSPGRRSKKDEAGRGDRLG